MIFPGVFFGGGHDSVSFLKNSRLKKHGRGDRV